jgi:hypothetical protein
MSTTPEIELLRGKLLEACEGDDRRLFALLDAARVYGLRAFLRETRSEFVCLYRGAPEKELAHVAPYLVKMPLASLLVPWLLVDTKAAESVMIVVANADLDALRTHLRRWLIVLDPRGEENFFRFYDPRVIEPFLDASSPAEAGRFFGPMRAILVCNHAPPVKEPLFRIWRAPEVPQTPPPNAFDQFVLRPEHETRFAKDTLAHYQRRCVTYLRSQHHQQLAEKSDEEVRSFVTRAMQMGDEAGLVAGRDVTILAQVLVLGGTSGDLREIAAGTAGERSKAVLRVRDRLMQAAAV